MKFYMAHCHNYANELDFWNANEVCYTLAAGSILWRSNVEITVLGQLLIFWPLGQMPYLFN